MGFDGAAYYGLPASTSVSKASQGNASSSSSTSSSQKLGTEAVLERLNAARRSGKTGRSIISRPATNQPSVHSLQQQQVSYNFPPHPVAVHPYEIPQQSLGQPNRIWPFKAPLQTAPRLYHQLPQKPQTMFPGSIGQSSLQPFQAIASISNQAFTPAGYGISPTAITANIAPLVIAPYPQDIRPNQASPPYSFPPQSCVSSSQRSYCKTCDMSFLSSVQFIAHQRNQHIRCCKFIEGCAFEGLPNIVELHEQDRHLVFKPGARPERTRPDGPLNARIQGTNLKLETEEEIARWIEERKRKWPTSKNQSLKAERDAKRRAYEADSPANAWQKGGAENGHTRTPAVRGRGRGRGREVFGRGKFDASQQSGERPVTLGRRTPAALQNPRPWQQQKSDQSLKQLDNPSNTARAREEAKEGYSSDFSTDSDDEEAGRIAAQLVRPLRLRTNTDRIKIMRDNDTGTEDLAEIASTSDSDEGPDELTSTHLHMSSTASRIARKDGSDVALGSDSEDDVRSEREVESERHGQPSVERSNGLEENASIQLPISPSEKRLCNAWTSTGMCKFGKSCVYSHDPSLRASRKRAGPPPRLANPFERDDLLGKLLHLEVKHEVSDFVQVVDFLARNEWLENVELYAGHKEEIEDKIQVLHTRQNKKGHEPASINIDKAASEPT